MKKYTSLNIGTALLISDILIAASTFFVFNVETGLFSILGLAMKSLVVDSVIENINVKKHFIIITTNPHLITKYINEELKRGATVLDAQGSFTEEKRWVVITILNRPEANALRRYVKKVDKHSFVIISDTSNIIGKGFREV